MKEKIKVAIVGVGNCASALVQGVEYYADTEGASGLAFPKVGDYEAGDIQFVAAFDIDERKVGLGLHEAIYSEPNCCYKIYDVNPILKEYYPIVQAGPILDGVADIMATKPAEQAFRPIQQERIIWHQEVEKMAAILIERKTDVLVNYLPVGSQEATEFWATVCLEAGVAMVNCIPVFIASDEQWAKKFIEKGIPIIGDDMRSQFGASIISAALQELMFNRGLDVEMHYQDNIGGNTDFLNMQDSSRLVSKKISKENVIREQNKIHGKEIQEDSIHAGPACYFPALGDNKRASWMIKARGFGGAPIEFTADLSVQDSPNSGGVTIDAIRLAKVATELGMCGPIVGPSAFTQKTPPIDLPTKTAHEECATLAKGFIPVSYIKKGEKVFHQSYKFKGKSIIDFHETKMIHNDGREYVFEFHRLGKKQKAFLVIVDPKNDEFYNIEKVYDETNLYIFDSDDLLEILEMRGLIDKKDWRIEEC